MVFHKKFAILGVSISIVAGLSLITANEVSLKPQIQLTSTSNESRDEIRGQIEQPVSKQDSQNDLARETIITIQGKRQPEQNAAPRRVVRSRFKPRASGDLVNYSQPYESQPDSSVINNQRVFGSTASDIPPPHAYAPAGAQRIVTVDGSGPVTGSDWAVDELNSPQEARAFHQPQDLGAALRQQGYHSAGPRRYSTRYRDDLGGSIHVASPSITSLNYADPYYQNSGHYPDYDHYMPSAAMGNVSMYENLPSYSMPHHHSHLSLAHLGQFDPAHVEALSGSLHARNRWSWPWIDASSYNNHVGLTTAATLKKFAHHHNHKDEHSHHDSDHLSAKWEHGITLGEIVCVALAVVLGIIILGSPFFLLYLMLFNGTSMIGANQMGLLAPAIPQGTAAAGRRKKRSISPFDSKPEDQLKRLSHDHEALGSYLMEQLSPFMNPEKLTDTFTRLMAVKDDIDKLVAKLRGPDKRTFDAEL